MEEVLAGFYCVRSWRFECFSNVACGKIGPDQVMVSTVSMAPRVVRLGVVRRAHPTRVVVS